MIKCIGFLFNMIILFNLVILIMFYSKRLQHEINSNQLECNVLFVRGRSRSKTLSKTAFE